MKRHVMIVLLSTLLALVGCASRKDNNRIKEIRAFDQIEKDFREGRITSEELGREMMNVGKEELERDYREGRISKVEYDRRAAVLLVEAIYQELAYAKDMDHLIHALETAGETDLEIAELIIYRYDGTVSMSVDKTQIGRSINSIDDHVQIDKNGLLATEGEVESSQIGTASREKVAHYGMVRTLVNHEACYGCHSTEKRVLGGLYIMINAKDM